MHCIGVKYGRVLHVHITHIIHVQSLETLRKKYFIITLHARELVMYKTLSIIYAKDAVKLLSLHS